MKRGARGQTAIFALLATTVVLVFALATANLGHMSTTAIKMSDAADAAALDLSSNLATKSFQLHKALGGTAQCRRTGWLAVGLAIVLAIVVIVATWGAATPGVAATFANFAAWAGAAANAGVVMAAGAIGGTIGGAIGGGIVHGSVEGAVRGGIQGGMIGLSISTGMTSGINMLQGMAANTAQNTALAAGANIATASEAAAAASFQALATYGPTAAAAGAAMPIASNIYNTAVREQVTSEAFASFARALNGLPDYERVRESALFLALSQTVQDPNRTTGTCYWPTESNPSGETRVQGDPLDSDDNGDREEDIPCFQQWWAQHLKEVKDGVQPPPGASSSGEVVDEFADQGGLWNGAATHAEGFVRLLDRKEIECSSSGNVDGPAVELWRTLYDYDVNGFSYPYRQDILPFWKPEPDRAGLFAWYNAECVGDVCGSGEPSGYDQVDAVRMEYENVIDTARGIVTPSQAGLSEDDLRYLRQANVRNWIPFLTDSSAAGDLIETLPLVRGYIQGWVDVTKRVRDGLPACKLEYGPYLPSSTTVLVAAQGPLSTPQDPIYQCQSGKQAYPWSGSEGVFFPRLPQDQNRFTPCKIYRGGLSNENGTLRQEVLNAERAVGQLEQHIRETFVPPCRRGDPTFDRVTPFDVGLKDDILTYTFQVEYTCRWTEMVEGWESTPCPPPPRGQPPQEGCQRLVSRPVPRSESDRTPVLRREWRGIGAANLTFPPTTAPIDLMPINQVTNILSDSGAFKTTLGRIPSTFATIDADEEDEFDQVLKNDALGGEPGRILGFENALKDLSGKLAASQDNETRDASDQPTRRNVEYTWRDLRGPHSVRVEIGPFRFAEIRSEKRGNFFVGKKCLVLRHFEDENTAWVRITRQEPTHAWGLWDWNRFFGGRTTKCASGHYSHNFVKLHDRCP